MSKKKPPSFPKEASETARATSLFSRALQFHQAGRLVEAEQCAESILRSYPQHFDAAYLLGLIALQTRRTGRGVELLTRAMSINPQFGPGYNDLGMALGELGWLAESLAAYDKAISMSPNLVQAHFNRGNVLRDLGRPRDAVAAFDVSVTMRPGHAPSHNNRGNALQDLGDFEEAIKSYTLAIELQPDFAEAFNNRGNAFKELSRFEEAIRDYDQCLLRKPNFVQAYVGRGAALTTLSRGDEALESFDKALEHDPKCAQAYNNKGHVLYQRGQRLEALECYAAAASLKPDHAEAYCNCGIVLSDLGRFPEAMTNLRKAISLNSRLGTSWIALAGTLVKQRNYEEALAVYDRALMLNPELAELWLERGNVLFELNRNDEAAHSFERSYEQDPNNIEARILACLAELQIVYRSHEEIVHRRDRYRDKLLRLQRDAEAGMLRGDMTKALRSGGPFLLAYQGQCDRNLQEVFGALTSEITRSDSPLIPTAGRIRSDEHIRIGIVSAFFLSHSNWKVPIKGWLSELDHSKFRIFGYHLGATQDEQTDSAAQMCHRFVQGSRDMERWRREILSDAPHVLIYPGLFMDGLSLQLAAQRLAPVQCSSWGHPETSGLQTIDFFLSSELMEPADAEEHYSEKLILLPNLSIYCEPLQPKSVAMSRSDLGLRSDACVFWCAQALFKYLPQHDHVIADIALRCRASQFVFIEYKGAPEITRIFRDRLDRAFAAHGLRGSDHYVFLPNMTLDRFMAASGLCDVYLDSIGWSGCNSTLESLEHNLPIVTLAGDLMRGRHSAAILRRMGISDTVASSEDELISIAARLGNEIEERRKASAQIAQNKHRIYRDRSCIAALEDFLERAMASS